MRHQPTRSMIAPLWCIAVMSPLAIAQDEADAPAEPLTIQQSAPPVGVLFFSTSERLLFSGSADLDDGGEYDVTRASASLGLRTRLNEQVSLSLNFSQTLDAYDFDGATALGADPWDDIHTTNLGAIFNVNFGNGWEMFGGPLLRASRESGADWSNSLNAGGFAGVATRVNEQLRVGGGVGVISQVDDDPRFFPIVILDWQIADDWTLTTTNTSNLNGVELVWDFAEQWEAGIGAAFASGRFRLDDEGVAPDGVGEEEYAALIGRLSWSAGQHLNIDLHAGMSFGGELTLENSAGRTIADDDLESSSIFGLNVRIQF